MRNLKKVIHNNRAYYSVGDAATYLGTTATKIRGMMGDGSLKWEQFRTNGKLYIPLLSLVGKKTAMNKKAK